MALLHGCTIHNDVLIGMGAIVMDGAVVESDVIVGAGSLVSNNKKLTTGLWIGRPAKFVRHLTKDELQSIRDNAAQYMWLTEQYLASRNDV